MINPSQISFVSPMDRNAQNRSNIMGRERQGLSPFDSILDMYKQNPLGNNTMPYKDMNGTVSLLGTKKLGGLD